MHQIRGAQEEFSSDFFPETLLVGFISSKRTLVGASIIGRYVSAKKAEKEPFWEQK